MRSKINVIDPQRFLMFVHYPSRFDAARRLGVWENEVEEKRDEYLKKAQVYQYELMEMSVTQLQEQIEIDFFLEQQHWDQLDWEISEYGNLERDRYWSASDYWTKEESVFLILCKEPEMFDLDKIKCFRSGAVFARKCIEIETLIDRSEAVGQLDYPLTPYSIVNWCRKRKIEFPNGLGDLVEEIHGHPKITEIRKPSDAEFGNRERESLLKLVIGLAIIAYRYDPKAARSTVSKELSDELAALGMQLSDDTIRKYLKEAAEFLPPPENR